MTCDFTHATQGAWRAQTLHTSRVHVLFACTFVASPEYVTDCTWKISGPALKCGLLRKFSIVTCNPNLNE